MSLHSLCSFFHWETNLGIQPQWKHTWTSCLTNNLSWSQVAVINVSHVRKIALIEKESFTFYWEAICWLLFLQNVMDGLSILQVQVSGRWGVGALGGGGVPHQSSSQRCFNDLERGSLKESEWQLIICKGDASRWSQTRTLRAGLLIFSSTCDYLQLWVYHSRKVKAMLDNGTIVGITLEPLRLQKEFLTKAIMQDCPKALSYHSIVSTSLKVKC